MVKNAQKTKPATDKTKPATDPAKKISNKRYEKELENLQVELVKMQEWIKHEGLKVVVIFEGRDAAGKGGTIKRITEPLNPRICRVVALPAPTEREQGQWVQTPICHSKPEFGIFLIRRCFLYPLSCS